jgi:putative transposase
VARRFFTYMARRLREELEGGVFHVFARGNGKQLIYLDDVDRRIYLAALGGVVRRTGWRCLAFCLMHNHLHLLLETPNANLASGMQRLHTLYAQSFNKRHGRHGHLFQGRYGAVRIRTDEQLWTVAHYLAQNPVEAGLCRGPREWPWSSYATVAAGHSPAWLDTDRLLTHFGVAGGDPRQRYIQFVEGSPRELHAVTARLQAFSKTSRK